MQLDNRPTTNLRKSRYVAAGAVFVGTAALLTLALWLYLTFGPIAIVDSLFELSGPRWNDLEWSEWRTATAPDPLTTVRERDGHTTIPLFRDIHITVREQVANNSTDTQIVRSGAIIDRSAVATVSVLGLVIALVVAWRVWCRSTAPPIAVDESEENR